MPSDMLPSFPSLRERNLRTLYGTTTETNGNNGSIIVINSDKSPKGSVDEKIRPLVDLINRHSEYVTLSSCSGRVALFDPAGASAADAADYDDDTLHDGVMNNDGDGNDGNDDDVKEETNQGKNLKEIDEENDIRTSSINNDAKQQQQQHDDDHKQHNNNNDQVLLVPQRKIKGTKLSGKGRGKWILVTHDILPDLGEQMIESLKNVGKDRLKIRRQSYHQQQQEQQQQQQQRKRYNTTINGNGDEPNTEPKTITNKPTTTTTNNNNYSNTTANTTNKEEEPFITFKHEPPLLHIAASSLQAGKKLLHIAKSICAMRESGLVVTDQRVTVELRTVGTLLCLPLMVRLNKQKLILEEEEEDDDVVSLLPNEEYLMRLADLANERMKQNEVLLDRLYREIQCGLFQDTSLDTTEYNNTVTIARNTSDGEEEEEEAYYPNNNSTNQSLSSGEEGLDNGLLEYDVRLHPLPPLNLWKAAGVVIPTKKIDDVDVLAFGGQGTGPILEGRGGKLPSCRRWDAIFRLARRNSVWSEHWAAIAIHSSNGTNAASDVSVSDSNEAIVSDFGTNAGTYRIREVCGLGSREGHAACILPTLTSGAANAQYGGLHAVAIFGGRTGGPLSPSNDLFLFILRNNEGKDDGALHESMTSDNTNAAGMLGIPVDVRGTPPEPRFGHSMTPLGDCGSSPSSRMKVLCDGEPLVVITGGTGVPNNDTAISDNDASYDPKPCGTTVTFSSVYILSRISEHESGYCHFLWSRISDLPTPRAYHATAMISLQGTNRMFVFGGVSESDDPLCPSGSTAFDTCFELPLFEKDGNKEGGEDSNDKKTFSLPSLIGASAAVIPLPPGSSKKAMSANVLLAGGVQVVASSTSSPNGQNDPLRILTWNADSHDALVGLKRARVSSIHSVKNSDLDLVGESSSEVVDFGTCVHHCLLPMPSQNQIPSKKGGREHDDGAVAISIGGGVPSFSFGQSYARSYLVNITQKKSDVSATSLNVRKKGPPSKKSPTPSKSIPGKPAKTELLVIADVLYVASRHAKKVKTELESLGYLDKRYKMVKVVSASADSVENRIAIPVTEHCISNLDKVKNKLPDIDCDDVDIHTLVGKESVPFSSSYTGKIKQNR